MPDTQNVAENKYERQVSGMYPAMTHGREKTDTRGLYPSMPETWNIAESKCGKEVLRGQLGGYSTEGMYPLPQHAQTTR